MLVFFCSLNHRVKVRIRPLKELCLLIHCVCFLRLLHYTRRVKVVYMPEPTTSSSQEFRNTGGKGEHPLKKRAESDFCENPFRYLRWTLKMFVTQVIFGVTIPWGVCHMLLWFEGWTSEGICYLSSLSHSV